MPRPGTISSNTFNVPQSQYGRLSPGNRTGLEGLGDTTASWDSSTGSPWLYGVPASSLINIDPALNVNVSPYPTSTLSDIGAWVSGNWLMLGAGALIIYLLKGRR